MHIWADADALPNAVKDILFRTADRRSLALTLVANRHIRIPASPHITFMQVPDGLDVADEQIVELVQPGDLVITADIPLAAAVVIDKRAYALNPRGVLYTERNIGQRSAMRDLMSELRSSGVDTGGPAAFGDRERQAFANQLDRFLTKQLRNANRHK